jgi:hypothetical protein
MKKLFVLTIALAIGGFTAAASADDSNSARRVQMRGRQLVHVTPKAPAPYALTGSEEADRNRHQSGIRGRSGTHSGHIR